MNLISTVRNRSVKQLSFDPIVVAGSASTNGTCSKSQEKELTMESIARRSTHLHGQRVVGGREKASGEVFGLLMNQAEARHECEGPRPGRHLLCPYPRT